MKQFEIEIIRKTIITVSSEPHTFTELVEKGIEQIDREWMNKDNTRIFVVPVDKEGKPTNKKAEIKVKSWY
jgi:hypothetical protein